MVDSELLGNEEKEIDIAVEKPEPIKPKCTAAQKMAAVNVIAVTVTVLATAGFLLLGERPTSSEIENRNLAEFPTFSIESYLDGSYTAAIATYYNDTVPEREYFKNFSATMRQCMGLQMSDVTIHGNLTASGTGTKPAVTTTQTTATTHTTTTTLSAPVADSVTTAPPATTQMQTAATTVTVEDDLEEGEISNNILIYKNRGIMLYGGSYAVGQNYASYVNAYHTDLGDGVRVYSMVVPTPCSFYTPEKYQYLSGSELDNINNINSYLNGVTPIDAYHVLESHKDEAIYMRTDHHWASLGAYYAAEEFSKVADVPFASISTFEKVVKSGYVGTLYGYSGDIKLKNNPEDFTYYVPSSSYVTTYFNTDMTHERQASLLLNLDNVAPVSWYLVYMGGDERITRIDTEVANERTLLIIKDSYGNALVPFFTSSFAHIYVIDMRYFTPNAIAFIQEHGVTDVLFAMNTFSATGGNAASIERIRTQ